MVKISANFGPRLQSEIQDALTQWVNTLSVEEADRKAICVSGVQYTPREIVREVKRKTEFGREFTSGLCSLHYWMIESEPGSSVLDLIRSTVTSTHKTPEIHLVARKAPDPTEHDPVAKEIGLAAGVIWRKLEERGGSAQTTLHEGIAIGSPLFEWAIGWLAREEQIMISMEKEPLATQEQIGSAAGVIWHALESKGELSQTDLREQVGVSPPIFDWAIGWLAREHKVVINQTKGYFVIRLTPEEEKKAASAW